MVYTIHPHELTEFLTVKQFLTWTHKIPDLRNKAIIRDNSSELYKEDSKLMSSAEL